MLREGDGRYYHPVEQAVRQYFMHHQFHKDRVCRDGTHSPFNIHPMVMLGVNSWPRRTDW